MENSNEEKKLIEKIVHKDEKALFYIYNEYKKPILRFIQKQLNDFNLAEEITQDVFLDFIEAIRDFHFQCSIKTFLFTIAKNKIVDVIRKKKIKKILFSALPSYFIEGLKTVLIDEEIEKRELAKKIKHVFDRLPNDYQLILRLKYIEGEKVRAIAQRLSLSFKATESLLFRARKSFIKVFQKIP